MTFISFAENLEDVMLRRAFKHEEHGFYIDIGAVNHGPGSVTRAFYDAGWRGINVMLDEEHRILMRDERNRDVCLCLNDDAKEPLGSDWDRFIEPGAAVQFLRVNCSGGYAFAVADALWIDHRPSLVLIARPAGSSSAGVVSQWHRHLMDRQYTLIYTDGVNDFYLADEAVEAQKESFSHGPNILDDYVTFESHRSDEEVLRLKDELSRVRRRAARAESALVEAKQSCVSMERSLSWRLTVPLRSLNPRHLARIGYGKAIGIRRRIRDAIKGGRNTADFIDLEFADFKLRFAAGPLADPRGIGRVAKEHLRMLRAFAEKSVNVAPGAGGERPSIHFYGSIHWCPPKLPARSVVMIHDVIPLQFPDTFPPRVVYEWREKFLPIAKQADHIITISQASAEAIHTFAGIPMEDITIVHNGVTPLNVDPAVVVDVPEVPYFVYLGAYDNHKNLDVVFRAMLKEPAQRIHLVMIGDNLKAQPVIEQHGLADRVHFMGKRPDEEVSHILQKSCGLVFPSLFEGFGLPPLEAALIGVPSICSDRPAMSELLVGGLFCDPHDEDGWAITMRRMVSDDAYRVDILARLQSRVQQYTWERSGSALADVLCKFEKAYKSA